MKNSPKGPGTALAVLGLLGTITVLLVCRFSLNTTRNTRLNVKSVQYRGVTLGVAKPLFGGRLRSGTSYTLNGITRFDGTEARTKYGFREETCVYIKSKEVEIIESTGIRHLLKDGMSFSEIENLLGTPNEKRHFPNGDALTIFDFESLNLRLVVEDLGPPSGSQASIAFDKIFGSNRKVEVFHQFSLSDTRDGGSAKRLYRPRAPGDS